MKLSNVQTPLNEPSMRSNVVHEKDGDVVHRSASPPGTVKEDVMSLIMQNHDKNDLPWDIAYRSLIDLGFKKRRLLN